MPGADMTTPTILSVGYEGRTLDEIVSTLIRHRVQVLVDVRLTAVSRKKGFSKASLATALDGANIGYRHEPSLGNPKDNREAFRQGSKAARKRFERHLANGARSRYSATVELARNSRVALFCFEREHSECHRSCIADRAQSEEPGFTVLEI